MDMAKAGRRCAVGMIAIAAGKSGPALAVEAERTMLHARTVGLSEADRDEVIAAMRQTVYPFSWADVRRRMSLRAMGLEWRP